MTQFHDMSRDTHMQYLSMTFYTLVARIKNWGGGQNGRVKSVIVCFPIMQDSIC